MKAKVKISIEVNSFNYCKTLFFCVIIFKDGVIMVKTNKGTKKTKKPIKRSNTRKKKKQESGMFDRKISLDILSFFIIAIFISLVSCIGTGVMLNYQYKKNNVLYNTSLVNDENLSDFIKAYSEIVENYYEEVDKKGMLTAATSAIVDYLKDNYSIYLDKDAAGVLNDSIDQSYQGIGIVVSGNVVYRVYPDSPAFDAGLQEGDIILKVNDSEITDDNKNNIPSFIKDGETNHIVVSRNDEELEFDVETNKVYIPTVNTQVVEKDDKKIGYLALSSFSSKSYDQFKEGLEELESESINSLVIDLRGNSGGYLETAKDIASLFIEKGKVIYSLENKKEKKDMKDDTDEARDYPIVILVNSSSASAAEVLTAALKDSYGATIVGETTYGKGKVQTLMQRNDSIIKYTSAKWLRPNGDCVDGEGITPDYEVGNVVVNKTIYDMQLQKALELAFK